MTISFFNKSSGLLLFSLAIKNILSNNCFLIIKNQPNEKDNNDFVNSLIDDSGFLIVISTSAMLF